MELISGRQIAPHRIVVSVTEMLELTTAELTKVARAEPAMAEERLVAALCRSMEEASILSVKLTGGE
jgi:hypothetical protein